MLPNPMSSDAAGVRAGYAHRFLKLLAVHDTPMSTEAHKLRFDTAPVHSNGFKPK